MEKKGFAMGMGAFSEFLFLFNLDISISFLNRRFS